MLSGSCKLQVVQVTLADVNASVFSAFMKPTCFAVVSAFFCIVGASAATLQPEHLPRELNAFRSGMLSGSVNGVNVLVPRVYLFGPVARNNVSPQKIEDFALLLRLSTLEPVTTTKDRADWQRDSSTAEPGFPSLWLIADIDTKSHYYDKKDTPHETLESWLKRDPVGWGPFELDSKRPYGLTHYSSIHGPDYSQAHGQFEYFYNANGPTTIVCETIRRKVVPFDTFDNCHDHFWDSDLNSTVDLFFTKKDIFRWAILENAVRTDIENFILLARDGKHD